MEDLGEALKASIEQIIEQWIRAVHQDSKIESARQLAHEAVRNSLPDVLEELATLLSHQQQGNVERLELRSAIHGFARAQQGYDTTEIIREYRLLRQVVLTVLEPQLLNGTPPEILAAARLIDNVLDSIITTSLESYIDARLTELNQMQSQLTLTNQELNRLVQIQQENLSFMAHELKTPLNSIIGHSTLLLRQQQGKIKAKDTAPGLDQLERVVRNSRRLLQLINDTLEISRYHEGQIQLNLTPLNLGEAVASIIEDALTPLAEEKGLQLEVDVSQAPQSAMGDQLRLQQLVTNLVSNAIRYTEEGSIQVSCRQVDADFWEMAIADTGIGISQEYQAQIFDPYAQVSAQGQSIASTGLGLAIVQRIVDLMAGAIEISSEVDQGTTFTVRLPLIHPDGSGST